MSNRMEGARQRSPQGSEWVSREEYDELRNHTNSLEAKVDNLSAQLAEMQRTQQLLLEKIGDIRKEDVEQKDSAPRGGLRQKLGAVATSAAAFFGKFFHRGEYMGDFNDEKEHDKGTKKGAHAKGKEESNTPTVASRRDEKPKRSREQEDKRNKSKKPTWRKVAVVAIVAAMASGLYTFAARPHKGAQDIQKPSATHELVMNDPLRLSEVKQALAEQEAEADLQNKANEMGMSVESMKRLADEHGMPYDKIGTDEAQHYLSDQLVAKNNIAEPFDASTPEKAKESLSFYVYNHKDVCAEFYAALHENPEGEVDGLDNPQDTIDYSEQFKGDDDAFKAARDEVIRELNKDGTKVTVRQATDRKVFTYHKIHKEGSDDGALGVGENPENSNGGNEYVVKVSFPSGITILIKGGCAQLAAPVPRVERVVAATPKQVKQEQGEWHNEEHHKEEQGEWHNKDHGHEEGEDETPPPNDAKNKHADDPQEDAEDNAKETPGSKDQADASKDKQVDKDGDGLPDPSGKSKSNNGEYDINGTQGDTSEDRPANKNNTEANNGGSGSGEHITGGGATDTGSGNQGGSGGGGTGSNKADSGGSGKETSQDSQRGSRSWTRDWGSEESGSYRRDSNGNEERKSNKSSYDTGRVERGGDNNNAASGDIELQSVPIMEKD